MWWIISLLFMTISLHADIEETDSFNTLLEKTISAPNNTIVLCDIDNTLLKASQQLGSVEWGDYIIQTLTEKGMDRNDAQEIESKLWNLIGPNIPIMLMQPEIPKIIQTIQQKGIPVVGLTARGATETSYTIRQLESLKISFTKMSPSFSLDQLSKYSQGVIFCSPFRSKASCLFFFLRKCQFPATQIIYIDDKIEYLYDLEEACNTQKVSFMGLRYSKADNLSKQFQPAIAHIQWKMFPKIISDEEAREIIKSQESNKAAQNIAELR